MATLQELKTEATNLRKQDKHDEALPLYQEIWSQEKNDWNGYYLAQCYRKSGQYADAREIQNIIIQSSPYFAPIKNEALWLDYSEKIKNWQNDDLLSDATEILSKTNQNDQYLGTLYTKTVLAVVKRLIYDNDNQNALNWLEKLDFNLLTNSTYKYKDQYYPSDKKTYFIQYADLIIKLGKYSDFIEECLRTLSFSDNKFASFRKHIFESITYGDYISRVRLALYLKYFKEEIRLRKNNSVELNYNVNKVTLISDLGDFEFCPVSYSISETFNIPNNETWQKDEWLGEKKHLIHRYSDFKKNKSFNEAFKDSTIQINQTLQNDFSKFFNSELLLNNYDGSNTTYYSNPTNTIRGVPDYVFKDQSGKSFVVIEKFTKKTSEEITTAFSNDLVKIYGYINELTTLKLSYGFLIYWYWDLEDIHDDQGRVKKKIRVKAYKIFEIKNTTQEKEHLRNTINKVQSFKQSKQFSVDGNRISHPNKCLNCSVVTHCCHKTGKFNLVRLPYNFNEFAISKEPSMTDNIVQQNTIIEPFDDLPF